MMLKTLVLAPFQCFPNLGIKGYHFSCIFPNLEKNLGLSETGNIFANIKNNYSLSLTVFGYKNGTSKGVPNSMRIREGKGKKSKKFIRETFEYGATLRKFLSTTKYP